MERNNRILLLLLKAHPFANYVVVHILAKIKGHLFDLQNSSSDVSMNIDMNVIKNNSDFNEEEEDDEEFIALLLSQTDTILKKPTLNYILDKINSSGYESLTEYEKDTLEVYSKN